MSREHLLLFDTASLYFRAFHGLPTTMRTPDGRPHNAVRGLADFLATFITAYRPTHIACCWDVDWRPGWRVAAVPTYKTHRLDHPAAGLPAPREWEPTSIERLRTWAQTDEDLPGELAAQVPMIMQVLVAAGIAVVGADHYEADDVIATLARTSGLPCDVVTGDRDLFQLVDDEMPIRVLYTAGRGGVANHVVFDGACLVDRYGVLPQQYADFALLRGDASDGLPGVAGIGEKSAAALLARYGDLEGVLAAASDPAGGITAGLRAKLAAGVDYLAAARDVVRVVDDIPMAVELDELRVSAAPDPGVMDALVDGLGLGGSGRRLIQALERVAAP